MLNKPKPNIYKKKYLLYKKLGNDKYYYTNDGINLNSTSKIICNYNYNNCVFKIKEKIDKKEEILNIWKRDVNEFQFFKHISGLDFQKWNYSIKDMALYLFNKYNNNNIEFKETTSKEEKYLYNLRRGGLRYSLDGIYNNYAELDINSFYPHILISKLKVPIGAPIEREITQEQIDKYKNFVYGLYNVKIEAENINKKLFIVNRSNIYTHKDLEIAKLLGYKITLISNKYFFYKNKVPLINVFRKYFGRIYKYKKSSPLAKKLLNIIWGLFGTLNKKDVFCKNQITELTDENLLEFIPKFDKNENLIKYTQTEKKIFKYNACRLSCFIPSLARFKLFEKIKNVSEHIVYIHTDGFIIKNDENLLKKFEISDELGKFKIKIANFKIEKGRKYII